MSVEREFTVKKMTRKRTAAEKSIFAQKLSTFMMLMGYNGDDQITAKKELERRIWKRKGRLSKKRIRRLQYYLYYADSVALLSFTVSLGKLIWSDYLRVKRRKFEKKLSEKVKQRSTKKTKRRGRTGRLRARRGLCVIKKSRERKGNGCISKFITGFRMRPVWGSKVRMVPRRRVTKKLTKTEFGSLLDRLAMAVSQLCYRNLIITSEWEFWAVYFIQKLCGFWRSIAIAQGLGDALVCLAKDCGLYVVSSKVFERMESCLGCSTSIRYRGGRFAEQINA